MAIQGFANAAIGRFFEEGTVDPKVGWARVGSVAARKLDVLHYAESLRDLASPPGNRLEALKGKLKGFYSIRINDQWRVIFRWTGAGPAEVDIVDYH